MALTKERRNEIAWLVLKHRIRKEGIRNLEPNDIRRELGNLAKATGASQEELKEFGKELLTEVLTESLEKAFRNLEKE
jgi:hypothetical protein